MNHRRLLTLLAGAAIVGAAVLAAGSRSSQWPDKAEELTAATHTRTVLSEVYSIDRIYRSMMGPSSSQSEAKNFEDRIGLARVDYLESEEGIAVFADHEYEMVSVYDNTTGEDQDSMAVMYMYLWDRGLDRRLAGGLPR